jgi:hypothetical protein
MLAVSAAVAVTGITLGLQARAGYGDDGLAQRSAAVMHHERHARMPVELSIAPPMPVSPRFGADASSTPRLEWRLAENTDGARVDLCPTDDFNEETTRHFDVDGEQVALPSPWPAGVWYWRLRGLNGGAVGDRATPTWMLYVSDPSTAWQEGQGTPNVVVRADRPTANVESPAPQFVPSSNDENDPEWYAKVAALIDEARSPGHRPGGE